MFVAAILDTWPELAEGLSTALGSVLASQAMPQGAGFRLVPRSAPAHDVIAGARFQVWRDDSQGRVDQQHRSLAEIREWLTGMGLEPPVLKRALHIFRLLAEAEGHVHGVSPERVTFHEVGAWDSVVDIVAAAWLIDQLGPCSWSVASLPLGSGTVKTAHGLLPLPAPATARLMCGFAVHDDGRAGERVTPTGMAILCHLEARSGSAAGPSWELDRTGFGLGTRELEGIPNALGAISFQQSEASSWDQGEVAVIEFDVDDQSPEDLGIGLDHMRSSDAVLDASHSIAYGKKGRIVFVVRVLAKPDQLEAAIGQCFHETTTIGVRYRLEQRATLEREQLLPQPGEHQVRRKTVRRPGGIQSTKVEADDLIQVEGGWVERERLRRTFP
jgi:uncharacterized protein (TIGR00299 family) protein